MSRFLRFGFTRVLSPRLAFAVASAIATVACGSGGASDGAVADEGNLTQTPVTPAACNAPVVSASGLYVLVDYCASGADPGKLVRREIASGAETTVATYAAGERLARIGASGDTFHYATLHAAGAAPGTATWHVTVNDWALSGAHDIQPNPQPADPTTYGVPLDVIVMPDRKNVVLTALLDTQVSEMPTPALGATGPSGKPLHVMVASLEGPAFTASVIPAGAAPTTYFWKDVATNRFDLAPDSKSVLFTTSSNDFGYQAAAYPITIASPPVSRGIAAGNVVAGSWDGTSYAEVRSVTVGYLNYPQLYVVTPPTRNGPSLCDDVGNAVVAGDSLVFVCRNWTTDRSELIARPRDGSGAPRTIASIDAQSGDFTASQWIKKALVTADGQSVLYFVGHHWYDYPTLGDGNQLASAPAAVFIAPLDGSKPPHQTIAQLNIAETVALADDQLLVHDVPAAGTDHYGVLDLHTGQVVASITRAQPSWRADGIGNGSFAITKDGSAVLDSQSCKLAAQPWQTAFQPTITRGGMTTVGTCAEGNVSFVRVPSSDAAIAVRRPRFESFTWAGGGYGHNVYSVDYLSP